MKKTISILLFFTLMFTLGSNNLKANHFSMTNIEQPIYRTFDGTTNVERLVDMEYKVNSKARFNILEFDNDDEDIHIVSMSNYSNFAWGTSTLEGMIYSFESKNPHLEVLGGVNGDFFDINDTKRPSGVFVQDYEILRGNSTRPVFNIRSDRTFDIGVPKRNGLEVLIIDKNNEVKFRERVNKHNKEVTKDSEVGIYFKNYESIDLEYDHIYLEAEDIKYTGTSTVEFAKGYLNKDLKIEDIDDEKFILVAKGINELIQDTDKVIIQYNLEGYENVRATSGGNRILLENGEIPNSILDTDDFNVHTAKHPRTMVGIKEDGSMFFVVNNGRDERENIPGLTSQEQAFLMKELGAVEALNLDGGGSSTMMARNFDGTFEVLNKLSDGNMRSVSTVLLIVRGDINEQPLHIKGEDTREIFDVPKNLFVDSNNNLSFNKVEGATRYIITIDGKEYETSKTNFSLNLFSPGLYDIEVSVKGNLNGKASNNSESIRYQIKEKTTNEILDWLKGFAKNSNLGDAA